MSIEGLDQYLQATKGGAFLQAMEQATKSDRLGRGDIRPRNQKSDALALQVRVVALWRFMSRPAWAFGVIVFAIVLDLVLFSD